MDIKEKNDLRNAAWKEDRERLFKKTDPYLSGIMYLDDNKLLELKQCVQNWRDMTLIEGYPDIDFPLATPSWLKFNSISTHKKSVDEFGDDNDNS